MNFLIKIEEAINSLISRFLENLKAMIPDFVFFLLSFLRHFPSFLKNKIQLYYPKLRVFVFKILSFATFFITFFRGYFITVLMYFRSDEFKNADKKTLILKPFKYSKNHPIKAASGFLAFILLIGAISLIAQNAEKIAMGTYSLRKPASLESAEEDVFIEIKNHKFEVKIGAAGGHGGHGAEPAEAHESELFLDLKIETENHEDKEFLEHSSEILDDNIEALELPVSQLPLIAENQKMIEEYMVKSLNEDLKKIGHEHLIKKINIKQIFKGRPQYYRQKERMTSVTDINLQIFLEDTNRNRQVWVDFSVLSSNRNVILYLNAHEVELKDHITSNVEPVIPQLPVEDEGRMIIKDKLKAEINLFLEKNGIEGKILEVYIDYLMAT